MENIQIEKVDVVCIGQAVVDCITRGKEENPHRKNVYRAENISLNTGGDAMNESVILSCLGHKVRIVCGVGKDLAGELIRHTAEEFHMDTSYITMNQKLITPIANLMVAKDGSRQSVNSQATKLTGYLPPAKAVLNSKIVSFASLFRAPLDQKEIILSLMKAAKESGAIICADTKMPTFHEIPLHEIKEFLPYIDYLFPNENEASYYSGIPVAGIASFKEMGEFFCKCGVKNVIIKAGKEGCVITTKETYMHIPAEKVEAVDSTGAGDNFVAGFIHGILNGWDIKKCAETGTECAAISVMHMGAVTGIKKKYGRDL